MEITKAREDIFEEFADLLDNFDAEDLEEEVVEISYPVQEYPEKIKSMGFDKMPVIEGLLKGIKGQYLMFEDGTVMNVRSHSGYLVKVEL